MASWKNKYLSLFLIENQTSVPIIDCSCSISFGHSAPVGSTIYSTQSTGAQSQFLLVLFSFSLLIFSFVEFRDLKSEAAAAVCPMNLFTLAPDENMSMRSLFYRFDKLSGEKEEEEESPTSRERSFSSSSLTCWSLRGVVRTMAHSTRKWISTCRVTVDQGGDEDRKETRKKPACSLEKRDASTSNHHWYASAIFVSLSGRGVYTVWYRRRCPSIGWPMLSRSTCLRYDRVSEENKGECEQWFIECFAITGDALRIIRHKYSTRNFKDLCTALTNQRFDRFSSVFDLEHLCDNQRGFNQNQSAKNDRSSIPLE